MLLGRGWGSLLAEKAEGAGFFNAGIAEIAEGHSGGPRLARPWIDRGGDTQALVASEAFA